MSNSEMYSKQVLDTLKNSCEKIKEIFNTVHNKKQSKKNLLIKYLILTKIFHQCYLIWVQI